MSGADDGDDGAYAERTEPSRNTIISHHRCHTANRSSCFPSVFIRGMFVRGIVRSQNACPRHEESGLFIGRLPAGRHSLRSEASITNPRYAAVKLGPNSKREGTALPL